MVDFLLATLTLLSIANGVHRGAIKDLFQLFAWVPTFGLSLMLFSNHLNPIIDPYAETDRSFLFYLCIMFAVSYITVFIAEYMVLRPLLSFYERHEISPLNKKLGAVTGALRFCIILYVGSVIYALYGHGDMEDTIAQSYVLPVLEKIGHSSANAIYEFGWVDYEKVYYREQTQEEYDHDRVKKLLKKSKGWH